jgi:hypothetical protein
MHNLCDRYPNTDSLSQSDLFYPRDREITHPSTWRHKNVNLESLE